MDKSVVFFSKYRPPSLIEAVGSPEKNLVLYGDVLVIYLFDIPTIFRHDGLQAVVERVAGLVDVGQ